MRDDVSRGVFVVQKPYPFAVKRAYPVPNWIGSYVRVVKRRAIAAGKTGKQERLLAHLSLQFILKHRLQFLHGVVNVFVLKRSIIIFKRKTHGV